MLHILFIKNNSKKRKREPKIYGSLFFIKKNKSYNTLQFFLHIKREQEMHSIYCLVLKLQLQKKEEDKNGFKSI